jgi:hypothetical protein
MSIDPSNLRGALTLYWNRRTETYFVQPMRRLGRLGLEAAGDGRVIDASDGDALPQVISDELDNFDNREGGSSQSPSKSREEEARFFREHDAVIVTKLLDGRVEFTPCEDFRGGYKAMSASTIALTPPIEGGAIWSSVEEAFARARGN